MPERELVLESLGCTPQNRRMVNRLQPAATAFFAGLPNAGRVCTRLGASHIAFSMSKYHSARTASRPSPSGAYGGLDPALAPWSSNQSRRRCGRICSALSYNLVDGNWGHVKGTLLTLWGILCDVTWCYAQATLTGPSAAIALRFIQIGFFDHTGFGGEFLF
jgi:hypothetical protein